jgi:hypothetical protein
MIWKLAKRVSVGPAVLQTVFDPKAAMAGFGLLRLQSPRDALLARWDQQQFRVCSTDRPNRARGPTGHRTGTFAPPQLFMKLDVNNDGKVPPFRPRVPSLFHPRQSKALRMQPRTVLPPVTLTLTRPQVSQEEFAKLDQVLAGEDVFFLSPCPLSN